MKTLIVATGLCLVVPGFPPGAATGTDKPSGFKVEARLNRDGPQLTVQMVEQPATSNWHYDIHVTTTDGLDQHFAIRNGQEVKEKDIRLADVNADGFLDITIVGGKDGGGKEWFKTWLYDTKGKKYRWLNDSAGSSTDVGGDHAGGNNDVFGHDRLCVTIWPEKTRVTEKERFDVKLRVVNSSDAIQSSRS